MKIFKPACVVALLALGFVGRAQDAGRDLSVSVTASPNPVAAGSILTYTISAVVPSGGATGLTVTDILPSGVNYVSGSAGCSNNQGTVTCSLGNLPAGTARSTIAARPSSGGSIQNVVGVIANEYDPIMSNNSATVTTTVTGGVTLVLSPSVLPDPIVGLTYNQTLTASGGTPPYTFSVSSGTLPAGLTLSGAVISGMPTTAGSSTFTIRATDSQSHSGTQSYTVTTWLNAAQLLGHTIPTSMTTGQVLTVTATMKNTGTTTWTTANGYRLGDAAPPYGVFGPQRADLTGTVVPTGSTTFTFTLTAPATPGDYLFGWRMLREGVQWFGDYAPAGGFYMHVTSPVTLVISPTTLPDPVVGLTYNQTLTASGGTPPYTFSVSSGTLPAGLTLSGAVISGMPTTAGSSTFTIRATDSQSHSGTQSYTVTTWLNAAQLLGHTIPTSMTTGQVLTVTATMKNTGTTTWTTANGYRLGDAAPPYGVFGPQRADLTGTVVPTGSTTFTFTLTAPATPGDYLFGWRMLREGVQWFGDYAPAGGFYMHVTSPVTLVISPTTLPDPIVGLTYNQTLTASGGTPPYTFSVSSGTLPAGLTLSGAVISGMPTTAGSSTFTIRATDSQSHSGTQSYSVTTWLNAAQLLGHTIPTSMTTGQVLTVTATMKNTGTTTWTTANGYRLGDAAPPYGVFGPQRADLTGTVVPTGSTTFTFTLTAPATPGDYLFGWRMLREGVQWFGDYAPAGGFYMHVTSPVTLVISPTTLPDPVVGLTYNQTLTASGGTPPYTFSVSSGTLPAGLTLSGAVISGMPTTAGSSTFTIRATDSQSHSGTQSYTVTTWLNAAQLLGHTIPTSMTTGQVLTVTATMKNTGTTTWTTANGHRLGDAAPPYGVFGPQRADLTGTVVPTGSTTFTFTLTAPATPGDYLFGWRMLREGVQWFGDYAPAGGFYMHVTSPVTLMISPTTLPDPIVGLTYNQTLTASGGTPPYTFSVSSGTLPAGLTLSGAVISGMPTTAGSSTFTIRATDSQSHSGTQSYSVTTWLDNAAVVSHTIPTSMTTGQVVTVNVTMRNTGTTTWTPGAYALGDAAPTPPGPGLFGPTRAALSGNVAPNVQTTFTFTLTAPMTPGSYSFGWRMVREGVHWLGAYAPVGGFTMVVTGPPIYQGYQDTTNCQVVGGWAWDQNRPNTPINVDIYADGSYLGTTLAGLFRQDLLDNHIGNGFHAFGYALPGYLLNGQAHSIAVKFGGTGTLLTWSPATVSCYVPIYTYQTPTSEAAGVSEVATQFRSSVGGSITHLRFWRASGEAGSHTLRLWNDSGAQLTSVFVASAVPGWNEVALPSAYPISAGVNYRVSYNTNSAVSKIFSDCGVLLYPFTNGPLTALAGFWSTTPGTFPGTSTCSLVFADVRFSQ